VSIRVRFWGVRGSIPTPGPATARYGGDTSCIEIRIADHVLICDGGTGLRKLGLDLLERGDGPITAHLFFSHSHWDHIQGFPFFNPAFLPTTTLYVYYAEPGQTRLRELLSGQMDTSYFPVQFSDLGAKIEHRAIPPSGYDLEGIAIRSMQLEHPGTSFGFAFEHGTAKVVYATDNEIDLTLPDADRVEADLDAPRAIQQDLLDFVRGATLLIGDGQYTEQEYPDKRGWGHSRVTTLVDVALQAEVKQLAVYHHDPMHDDEDVEAIVAACRQRVTRLGGTLGVFAAREGMELKLD